MAITIAEKVLIAGGVLNPAYGVLLAYPITVIRAKRAPAVSKYLMATHVGACCTLRCCSAGTLNWLTGVKDEFSEKARTAPLGALGARGETIGVGTFVIGVLKAL